MRYIFCIWSVLCLLPFGSYGQDLHFSQFFAAPLTVNPANTGSFTGAWRIGLNYRDQWGSVTIPYRTYDIYSDGIVQPKGAKNKLGLGFYMANDVAGDGELTTTKAMGSAAYQLSLSEDNSYYLSIGMSGGIVQKRIDLTKLLFDSQWNGYSFDSNLSNGEDGVADNISYLDFCIGGVLSASPFYGERYYAGIALHHINKPEESFMSENNAIGVRTTATAGAYFPVHRQIKVNPQIFFSTQKNAREIIIGGNISLPLQTGGIEIDNRFFAGMWYRYMDAAWCVLGLTISNLTFSASYDFNLSELTTASRTFGGLELALVYTLSKGNKRDPLNCPAYE